MNIAMKSWIYADSGHVNFVTRIFSPLDTGHYVVCLISLLQSILDCIGYSFTSWNLFNFVAMWIDDIFLHAEDGRNGTFMIGDESFPASLLDLPAVVESYKTYDDSVLIKTSDIGQKC
jgi:hypothetical protein